MSLSSVLATAASGISAAELSLGVIANNLANCRTPGFKASRAAFATQPPQTRSSGAAPAARDGGGNPVQIGTGVFVAEVSRDFSQGSIALDSSPTSLAIQGDGLFILEGSGGERLYSRDGRFSINAEGQLVSVGGHRVLGFPADEQFRIQRTEPAPLEIPAALSVPGEDGQTATLVGFSIAEDGRVRGRFSDGISRDLGQIALARFANPSDLVSQGQSLYAPGPNSGLPVVSSPGEAGAGQLVAGAVELSNADIGESLVDLMLASTQFRANLQVLLTADGLLDELMAIGRAR
jgi:flagellar hook protein FlgE